MASRLIVIRAGESIFIDFVKQGATLDATVEASYIMEDAEGVEEISGVLTKNVDDLTFELRVSSVDTAGLADADYLMLVKVFDDTTGYADYIFEETVRVYS